MAASSGETTGTTHPAESDYFEWTPDASPVSIRMHLDAIDGISRDVLESVNAAPKDGLEVGGLLLGKAESGDLSSVLIERYQRIPCGHRLGPRFVLDSEDRIALEEAAGNILRTGDLSVVGLYRSHCRPDLQLERGDFELIDRYFRDPSDLLLLIKPESTMDMSARFFRREPDGSALPVGPAFPFRARGLNLTTMNGTEENDTEELEKQIDSRERPRRLVPDFVPSAVLPSRTPPPELASFSTTSPSTERTGRNWWPLILAILLVSCGAWLLLLQNRRLPATGTPETAAIPAADRPLGLYVDPVGESWRVSWNPNATALHDARSVRLFVREGDDQNRVDLSPGDLASGIYQYRSSANGNDVTFRLEATENSGRISAESFRVLHPSTTVAAPAAPPAPAAPARVTEPRAIHRVPPVVPASIKPRIKASIPIDIRVHIDAAGRVTSAAPAAKQSSGLHAYLAGRAVEAARLWRFEPARENGKPVPGTDTIRFVFQN